MLAMPAWGSAQKLAVKTNLLYDALLIPSLGAELAVGQRSTVNLTATYNPFSFGERKWKNWSLQPEYRYWLRQYSVTHATDTVLYAAL